MDGMQLSASDVKAQRIAEVLNVQLLGANELGAVRVEVGGDEPRQCRRRSLVLRVHLRVRSQCGSLYLFSLPRSAINGWVRVVNPELNWQCML